MLNALKEYVESDEFSSTHRKNFSGMDQAVRTHRSVRFTDLNSSALTTGLESFQVPCQLTTTQSCLHSLLLMNLKSLSKPGEWKFCSTQYELWLSRLPSFQLWERGLSQIGDFPRITQTFQTSQVPSVKSF